MNFLIINSVLYYCYHIFLFKNYSIFSIIIEKHSYFDFIIYIISYIFLALPSYIFYITWDTISVIPGSIFPL